MPHPAPALGFARRIAAAVRRLALLAALGAATAALAAESAFLTQQPLYRLIAGEPALDARPPEPRQTVVRKTGALMTRLFPDEDIGRIFQLHGYQATFVVRTPALYRHDEAYKAMLRRLVAMGHDVGYWTDKSASCIQLYAPGDLADFLALDRDPEVWDAATQQPRRDEYGSPKTGIAEVLTIRGETYLGLNNSIKYQTPRDVVVRLVHGTDRIVIENLPPVILAGSFYIYFEPDEKAVPAKIRGQWVTVGNQTDRKLPAREQPVTLYEAISLRDYTGELFANPANGTVLVKAGLDINHRGNEYTTVNRSVGYTNRPNERARYYTYAHAIRAFHLMGLPRPDTVGEPRCLYESTSPSARPLKQLGFRAGGVDPLHGGHTYYMPDDLRYRISTSGGGAPPPLAHTDLTMRRNAEFIDTVFEGKANGIGFNVNYFDHGPQFDYVGYAFSRICQAVAKNRFINERQTVVYTDREKRLWHELLQRCQEANLPVLSQRQAMIHLFDNAPDDASPVPAIQTDLDRDGIPDGYGLIPPGCRWETVPDVVLEKFRGRHFARNTAGPVFEIKWMGGIKPGRSTVRLWASGAAGDRLRVSLVLKQYRMIEGQRFGQTVTDLVSDYDLRISQPGWHLLEVGTLDKRTDCFFNDIAVTVTEKAGVDPVRVSQLIIE